MIIYALVRVGDGIFCRVRTILPTSLVDSNKGVLAFSPDGPCSAENGVVAFSFAASARHRCRWLLESRLTSCCFIWWFPRLGCFIGVPMKRETHPCEGLFSGPHFFPQSPLWTAAHQAAPPERLTRRTWGSTPTQRCAGHDYTETRQLA